MASLHSGKNTNADAGEGKRAWIGSSLIEIGVGLGQAMLDVISKPPGQRLEGDRRPIVQAEEQRPALGIAGRSHRCSRGTKCR
jgi:hypothetical protein